MPKVIKRGVRKITLQVREFFKKEKKKKGPIIPFEKVNERVAAATGVSLRTIVRIAKEGAVAAATSNKIVTPNKHRKVRKDKLLFDNFEIGILRRQIHEFYNTRKEIPTLPKLQAVLKEEINFQASQELLRKLLLENGFKFVNTKNKRRVLIEKNTISAKRASYLQAIQHNDKFVKLPIVYLSETYIDSGLAARKSRQDGETDSASDPICKSERYIVAYARGERGYDENYCSLIFKSQSRAGDPHDEVNHLIFTKWVREKLGPNIKQPSLIVMDNAPHNNSVLNKAPSTNNTKGEIMEWLINNSIEFNHVCSKPELLEIVKRNKPEPVYAIDDILKGFGHEILRLPPYHCDLNPVEMVWAYIKGKVADVNVRKSCSELPEIVESAFRTISTEEWGRYCSHAKQLEGEYRANDHYLDQPLIIELNSDDDSSGSDDIEDEHYDDSDMKTFAGKVIQEHNYYIEDEQN